MIAKPTTEQILNDCSRELMEVVLPAVTDETVQVTIYMMDLVLRNAAVRAAHEIAWMTEEIAELEAFAGVRRSVDARRRSLHLDDVVERYRAAERGVLRGDGGGRRRRRRRAHQAGHRVARPACRARSRRSCAAGARSGADAVSPLDTVRMFMASIEARDLDYALAYVDQDIVYDNVPMQAVHGPDAVRATLQPFLDRCSQVEWIVHREAETDGVVFNERLDRFLIDGRWIEIAVSGCMGGSRRADLPVA